MLYSDFQSVPTLIRAFYTLIMHNKIDCLIDYITSCLTNYTNIIQDS